MIYAVAACSIRSTYALRQRIGSLILILDHRGNAPRFVLFQSCSTALIGVSPSPNGRFCALILFAILDMQRRDFVVVLLQIIDSIVVRRRQVADIEIDQDIRISVQRLGKTLGRGELVRVLHIRVVMHRDLDT